VLFEFGEQVLSSDWEPAAFALSPRAQLSFLIGDLLEGWGQVQAGAHLLEAFKKCDSAAFCADVFVDRARELGKIPNQSQRTPTVTENDLQALGAEVLAKIERAAADGTLRDAPFYFDITTVWSYLGKAADAKAWLSAGMMESSQFLAKMAMGLVSYSLGRRERSYTIRERPDDQLYDLKVLRDATIKHMESGELSQDERNRIRAVREGVESILESDAKEAAKAAAAKDEA
jgi:hypothetical protein